MNSKQLRYFHEVARLQSFSKAAETLHIAQPAISMSIQKFERQLDIRLFHRNDRKISLTDEGQRLFRHAAIILKNIDDAESEMRELKGLTQGSVRIGIPSMLGSYYFPPILMAFKHLHPKLNLEVIEGGTWQLQQMVEHGELDLGVIVSEFVPEILHTELFLQEQMLVTVSKDHRFATQQSVTYEDFFSEELVMFQEGYFHRKIVDRIAAQIGAKPNIGFETNLIPLIKSIVKQGFGISTLLGMVIEDDDDLIALPFSQPVRLDLSIAWNKDRYLSQANQAFVRFMLDHRSSQKAKQTL
ncbi:LysR family transcriptional regulator [Neptunomonas qingdaonensis]|uniref:DNA-binding transcriptional regulator, LysR family n=1 Tax=Neptunomonas qingdaonensis TaxID=1045558 RepID=A0A1I2M3T0_9GAMM|nr:LysR family transcriptional regulator [Neptunomonas qingdaonensis]SFF86105.1 DNA-binding transcriptional regulator, LysR family [Neptunomonas qingdaonensis]